MRIVFVSDAIYPYNKGGKEKRLMELSTRLARLGHDVHIYTMHWWDTPETTRTEQGVQLHALCKKYPMYNGERRSIKEGVMFGLACLKLFRVRFDVLDVDHMPFFPIFSSWLVCTLRRRKLHGTWHEALRREEWLSYMGKGGHIAAIIERLSIALPYHITASSPHTKVLLGSVHKRNRRVGVVTPGIDIAALQRIEPIPEAIDVLYVGRLVKDKNVDKLIQAVALCGQDRPALRCTIIGHGIEKQRLQRLITTLGVADNVRLQEPLADANDIYAYMKAAKVFCLPSVREGFGIVALEALACGTPVITTDAAGNAAKDLIQNGQTGAVVRLTPESLASAIMTWTTNDTVRPDPAASVAEYDWNALARRQESAYNLEGSI